MVKQKVVVDTNLIIDHLRQKVKQRVKTQLEKIIEEESISPLISSATIQELFAGQSSKKIEEKRKIRRILSCFAITNISPKMAETAGKIMRETKPVVQFADAQIAATAILEKAYLATKNKKDFKNIKGLKFYG